MSGACGGPCSQSARLLEPQDRRQLALPLLLLQQHALLLPVVDGAASDLPKPLRLLRIVCCGEPRRAIIPSLVLLGQHTCRQCVSSVKESWTARHTPSKQAAFTTAKTIVLFPHWPDDKYAIPDVDVGE